jgi:hypothetical protein
VKVCNASYESGANFDRQIFFQFDRRSASLRTASNGHATAAEKRDEIAPFPLMGMHPTPNERKERAFVG